MRHLVAVLTALFMLPALANEAVIRKVVPERMPNLPKIDEVRPAPVPGLWEVRFGADIYYTDPTGTYLLHGDLLDIKSRKNLTDERVTQISKVDFASLPIKDAVVWKSGTGARKIAVFADPNCGYCRRFEAQLQELKDITVYTFLVPILGGDSPQKSRAVWCAKDSTAAWLGLMLRGEAPPAAAAGCDASAIDRNSALANRVFVRGTPAIILPDGNRIPGAVSGPELDRRINLALNPASKS